MILSIDFGGSTIDVLSRDKKSPFEYLNIQTFERSQLFRKKNENIDSIFRVINFSSFPGSRKKVEKIFVTGGKSRFLSEKFGDISVVKISEIQAIGQGGFFLLHRDRALQRYRHAPKVLVVSMGTGSCMVQFEQRQGVLKQCYHVGGTGVGGGTFLGLAKVLLHETDVEKLKKLFQSGNTEHVDLSVGDIIGSGIGLVPPDATASHLAQLVNMKMVNFSRADLAAAIVNLIGQTIGLLAVFAAKASGASIIMLTGKLTAMQKILDIMVDISHIYSIPMLVPRDALYVSSFGAWGDV